MSNTTLKFTFKDGSEALAHYGVKGMKWGVWNDETRAKYSGGDSSWKGAKKTAKDLNALDKRRAVEVGKASNATKQADRYQKKAQRIANRNGSPDKFLDTMDRSLQQREVASQHAQAVKGIEKQQAALSKKLVSEGYTVKTKNVSRSTLTTGEKVLRDALFVAELVSPSPAALYIDSRTRGTKYSVKKPKSK